MLPLRVMKKKKHTHLLYISLLIAASIILLGGCSILKKPAQESPDETVQLPQQAGLKAEIPAEEKQLPIEESTVKEDVSQQVVQENKIEEIDPEEKLEEAEADYNDAQYAWQRGDMDTARNPAASGFTAEPGQIRSASPHCPTYSRNPCFTPDRCPQQP